MSLFRSILDGSRTRDGSWESIESFMSNLFDQRSRLSLGALSSSSVTRAHGVDSVLYATDASLHQLVVDLIQSTLQQPSTVSLRGAGNLARLIRHPQLIQHVREQQRVFKLRQLVTKEKWRVAAQVLKTDEVFTSLTHGYYFRRFVDVQLRQCEITAI